MRSKYLLAAFAALLFSAQPALADRTYDEVIAELERSNPIEGELALRIIALGLQNAERRMELAPDEVFCYYGKPTGTHTMHVLCGEAQDMGAGTGTGSQGFRSDGQSQLGDATASYVIAARIRRGRVSAAIPQLPGIPEMNATLVDLGLRGMSMPKDLAGAEELDRFVTVYRAVDAISERYDPQIERRTGDEQRRLIAESDRAMSEAITSNGFTVTRYNEVTDQVGTYPEMFEYVRRAMSQR